MTPHDRWNIKGRWADIERLSKNADTLLGAILEGAPYGHISPGDPEPPKWRMSLLYELVRGRMDQEGLRLAMKELHEKGILLLAYAYHSGSYSYGRLTELYRNPRALHQAIREREKTNVLDLLRIEIYLVLPEDETVMK